MGNRYTVTVYDDEGFPLNRGKSLQVNHQTQEGKDFLEFGESGRVTLMELAPGQPKFIDSANPPFSFYRLADNRTVSIKANN